MCPRVAAPAVLMHVKVEYVGAQAARCAGQHLATARSLYPYFCSASETEQLTRRVLALTDPAEHARAAEAGPIHGSAPTPAGAATAQATARRVA
jgi:hypothetical protein